MSEPRRGSLFVIFLTVFIDLLGFGMVLPLLPNYAATFDVDAGGFVIGLLMSSFSAMQFLFAPWWGRLSDRIGRRPVLMIGLAGSAVCYTIFAVAAVQESLTLLFVSRIGAGVAGATISTAQAYIADVTPLSGRAKGMALIGAAFGLGFTFGPLFGAGALLIADEGSLSPWPGYLAAGLSTAALMMAYFRLPESLPRDLKPKRRALIDWSSLHEALRIPSIALLLLTMFISVLSFANFESTLALLLKQPEGGFKFTDSHVLLVFTYIGFVLTVVQGGVVRRLADRVAERALATFGAAVALVGFVLMSVSANSSSFTLLMIALAVEVTGFAFITPSVNSLISRRSDPAKQGGILGVGQSVSSLSRIVGPMIGIPLFYRTAELPYWTGAALMLVALVLITIAVRAGGDFPTEETGELKQPASDGITST
ncbi:MAG: MFS transporter [Pirellulales bacterium]